MILRKGAALLVQLSNINLTRAEKTIRVLIRLGLRMAILIAFAAFGSIGFGQSLIVLLWMSAILSAVLATIKREVPLDAALNHWDEMTVYAALCFLTAGLDHSVPI
jgi:hypothetical protein